MNSCNPVFMEVGARVGVAGLFEGMKKFGILEKTGIDVPGEAATIMHKQENVGAVELATMSFGQSFQLSPIRMLTSVCMIINGGKKITPPSLTTFSSALRTSSETDASNTFFPEEYDIFFILVLSEAKREPARNFPAGMANTLLPVSDFRQWIIQV